MEHTENPLILVVDDIAANLELVCSFLSGQYTTAIAKNGEKAVERALKLQPHLILLDVQMPDINGFEVCRRLQKMDETRHIPVIFMTSLNDVEDKVTGFEVGGVDFLSKPIESAELLARIDTHLSVHRMKQELEEKNRLLELNAERQKRVDKIMRHDLKSPLQAMINIPEILLMDDDLSDSSKSLVALLEEAGQNMLNMINSSLTLYKIEQGVYEPQMESVRLLRVVRQAADPVQAHFSEVALLVDDLDDRCAVQGEELLLFTLFSNLLKNAFEASPLPGTITVSVSEAEAVSIRIHNRGAVPEAIRESFFEEFSTSGKSLGTGLGTYSAMLIAEVLGGSLSLDTSEPGATSIVVTLQKGSHRNDIH